MPKRLIFLFIFLLLLPVSSFASDSWEITSYGNGAFIADLLDGIKMLLGGGVIQSIVKILLISTLITAIATPLTAALSGNQQAASAYGSDGLIALINRAMTAGIVMAVLITPTVNVTVIDKVDPTQNRTVTGVPMVTGVVASWTSTMGTEMGELLDQAIMPVDSLRYTTSGKLGLGALYTNHIFDIEPPGDALIKNGIVRYFEACIIPNFAVVNDGPDGPKYTGLINLTKSGDLLAEYTDVIYKDRHKYIGITLKPHPEDTEAEGSCYFAIADIQEKWNEKYNDWLTTINNKILGVNAMDPGNMSAVIGVMNRYFPSAGGYTPDNIKQLAVLNAMNYALLNYSSMTGNDSKNNITDKQTGGGWIEVARMSGKVLIMMRNLFESLIIGLSVLLPIAFVVAGIPAIIQYVKIAFWVQLWTPILVIIAAMSDHIFAKDIADTLCNSTGNCVFSWENVDAMRSKSNLMLGYLGMFSWAVPAVAWAGVNGLASVMSHAITAAGGAMERTAGKIGESKALDNVAVGQKKFMFSDSATAGAVRSRADQVNQYNTNRDYETMRTMISNLGSERNAVSSEAFTSAVNRIQAVGDAEGKMEALGNDLKNVKPYGKKTGFTNTMKAGGEAEGYPEKIATITQKTGKSGMEAAAAEQWEKPLTDTISAKYSASVNDRYAKAYESDKKIAEQAGEKFDTATKAVLAEFSGIDKGDKKGWSYKDASGKTHSMETATQTRDALAKEIKDTLGNEITHTQANEIATSTILAAEAGVKTPEALSKIFSASLSLRRQSSSSHKDTTAKAEKILNSVGMAKIQEASKTFTEAIKATKSTETANTRDKAKGHTAGMKANIDKMVGAANDYSKAYSSAETSKENWETARQNSYETGRNLAKEFYYNGLKGDYHLAARVAGGDKDSTDYVEKKFNQWLSERRGNSETEKKIDTESNRINPAVQAEIDKSPKGSNPQEYYNAKNDEIKATARQMGLDPQVIQKMAADPKNQKMLQKIMTEKGLKPQQTQDLMLTPQDISHINNRYNDNAEPLKDKGNIDKKRQELTDKNTWRQNNSIIGDVGNVAGGMIDNRLGEAGTKGVKGFMQSVGKVERKEE